MKPRFLLLSTLIGCISCCQQSPATTEMNLTDTQWCPVAEWDTAKVVLMHTPSMELFDGVIHPTAGLFEHYFNVDSAVVEHHNYIELLQRRGIRVYTITDILQQMPIDTLRALAGQVLRYDISQLSAQDTASVGEQYRWQTLMQMSRNDMIRCLMWQPTVVLSKVDNNTGYEATYQHNSLMNLYFTRDQSITTPCGGILCQMNSTQRAPETRIIRACYQALGIPPILEITGEGRLEGGDYLPAGTLSFIGCGMRTNREAICQMMAADAMGHDTIVIVYDHKFWQMQMHLDTYFNLIDKDLCTLVNSRLQAKEGDPEYVTIDIYARAHGEKEYHCYAEQMPFVSWLQERGYTIIPIDEADEMHYANNYLTIAPRHIVAVKGQSKVFQQRLQEAGVTVDWLDVEQLIDGYGAAHCMTQVIRRKH